LFVCVVFVLVVVVGCCLVVGLVLFVCVVLVVLGGRGPCWAPPTQCAHTWVLCFAVCACGYCDGVIRVPSLFPFLLWICRRSLPILRMLLRSGLIRVVL
jgi:hypothetical protein